MTKVKVFEKYVDLQGQGQQELSEDNDARRAATITK